MGKDMLSNLRGREGWSIISRAGLKVGVVVGLRC